MSLTPEQQAKLKTQVEFYFSDVNIAKDVFLKSKMAESAEGFVPLSVLLTFNRINSVTKDQAELLTALSGSEALVVDKEAMAVRRAAPLPESIQTDGETVYVKPIPATATLEELQEFFGKFGTVRAVWRRYFAGNSKSAERQPKTSVFVVFTNRAEAEKLKAEPPKYGDDQLLVQWATEYHAQKAAEMAAKNKGKIAAKEAKEAKEPRTATPSMPKDASYTISGCGDIEKFSAIKGLWPQDEQRGVRYVFTPSKDVAQVIFQDADTGATMVKDLAERATTLNGTIPTVTKLAGDDEAALLANVEKEISERAAANPGGRGRGGRGGRGGARGGRGQKRSRD